MTVHSGIAMTRPSICTPNHTYARGSNDAAHQKASVAASPVAMHKWQQQQQRNSDTTTKCNQSSSSHLVSWANTHTHQKSVMCVLRHLLQRAIPANDDNGFVPAMTVSINRCSKRSCSVSHTQDWQHLSQTSSLPEHSKQPKCNQQNVHSKKCKCTVHHS